MLNSYRFFSFSLFAVFFCLSGCSPVDDIVVNITDEAPVLIEKGSKLFQIYCISCHRREGIGAPGVAPSLTSEEFLANASDTFLKHTIRDGRPKSGMPSFAKLGDLKIAAIVAYFRSYATLPNRSAEIDAQEVSHGDPEQGQKFYKLKCSLCHGYKGDGYLWGGTGPAIGRASFLDIASDGYIRTTVKEGRGSRMPRFQREKGTSRLTDKEIEDIIAYLRQLRH
jgi:cbb3-type cytochrome c oxidase subunit III